MLAAFGRADVQYGVQLYKSCSVDLGPPRGMKLAQLAATVCMHARCASWWVDPKLTESIGPVDNTRKYNVSPNATRLGRSETRAQHYSRPSLALSATCPALTSRLLLSTVAGLRRRGARVGVVTRGASGATAHPQARRVAWKLPPFGPPNPTEFVGYAPPRDVSSPASARSIEPSRRSHAFNPTKRHVLSRG